MPREFLIDRFGPVTVGEFLGLQDDAAAVVWDAGVVMCYYLLHLNTAGKCVVRGKSVLELGCGPGAVGLVSAALGARSVALTDLPHVLPHTAQNIQENKMESVAAALPLTWGNENDLEAVLAWFAQRQGGVDRSATASSSDGHASQEPASSSPSANEASSRRFPDVVLASDVAYNREHLPALAQLLAQLCAGDGHGPPPLVLMSIEDREQIHQQVLDVLHAAQLEVIEIPQSEQHPDWQSDDIYILQLRHKGTDKGLISS